MYKAIKVLLIIAVAGAMAQVSYNVVLCLTKKDTGMSPYQFDTLIRVLVYWLSGIVGAVISFRLWKKQQIMSLAIGAGGIYLMTLGANGGLMGRSILWLRLLLAVFNLVFFLIVLKRIDAESRIICQAQK